MKLYYFSLMFLASCFLLFIEGCGSVQFGNISLQDTSFGHQHNVTKTNTVTQELEQKMVQMKDVEVTYTPEMKKAFKEGKDKAIKYMNKNGIGQPISNEIDAEFFKRNKRIKDVRPSLVWVAKMTWRMGYRFLVVTGHRPVSEQRKLCKSGASQICEGSQHNFRPSRAIDIVPLDGKRLQWGDDKKWQQKDYRQYAMINGTFLALTEAYKTIFGVQISARWGRDWGCHMTSFHPTTFADLAHFAHRDDNKGCGKEEKLKAWRIYEKARFFSLFESSWKNPIPRSLPKEYLVRQVALLPGRELVHESLVQGPKSRPRFPYGKNY